MKNRFAIKISNQVLLVLLSLAIVLLLNILAYRSGVRFDVTANKMHSLSDQSVKVIANIDEEVEILAFFKEMGLDRAEFQGLISLYERESDKIKVHFVDSDKEPGVAKKYDVSENATVVFVKGEKEIKLKLGDPLSGGILITSEQQITNALIKLSKDVQKKVYFLTGHGENDINESIAPSGFGKFRKALEDESYVTEDILLMRVGKIEVENSLFVVASPKTKLTEGEIEAIKTYLDNGGAALFLIEPNAGGQVVELLTEYGIKYNNDVVIDPTSKLYGQGDVSPIVAIYPLSDITQDFKFATIFPYTRSLNAESNQKISAQVIAKTSEYSWSETDLELFADGEAVFNSDEDKVGPLGVAAIAGLRDGGRIAAYGSDDIVSNLFIEFSGNRDLLLNTVNWLTKDESFISIRPKVGKEGKINITPGQINFLQFFTIVGLPGIVMLVGIIVWLKRRNV